MDALAERDGDVLTADSDGDRLPYSLTMELIVKDAETIAELCRHLEGPDRDQFALDALRIGVLALRQARGQLDVDLIQRETQRMLGTLANRLDEHSRAVQNHLATSLKDYFDPESGRFNERVKRLVEKDGELERVLRSQIGSQDSELCKTLLAHFGESSPLMKVLSPTESQGLLAALRDTVGTQLTQQRETVLKEFSLDNRQGALARLVDELTQKHGQLADKLQDKINTVVKEFSLDEENSALSRLVRNVDRAQKTISNEFSLDNKDSAFSRLQGLLQTTSDAIHSNLTLDEETSSLARLRREMLSILEQHSKANTEFREEVKVTLAAMVARKQEAERSTRHGMVFEDAVGECLQRQCQPQGDILSRTGSTTGLIKNSKVGDFVIELGPDCAAPCARIVVEAKEEIDYTLAKARLEIDTARKNRDAQIGLFVFSKRTAPSGLDGLARYGDDIFVVWDAEDASSDFLMRVSLTLAKALCIRTGRQSKAQAADFEAITAAILEIEKQTQSLEEVKKSAETIQGSSEKILERVRISRGKLERQVETLKEKFSELKASLGAPSDA
jgi:hypothetical protein